MTGEMAFDGVYVPTLLILGMIAALLTIGVIRVVAAFGLYRFVAYRALVDLCLFIMTFGLLAWLAPQLGIQP